METTTERLANAVTRSTDTRLPLWLRLVALVVERYDLDQDAARFAPGELRQLLNVTGVDLHPASLTRAIRTAEAHGFLVEKSTARVLRLVPGSLTYEPEGVAS